MSDYYLAQINIAHMLSPLDDPIMADFVNNIDRINALAEGAPGFVWRLQTDEGDATAIRVFDNNMLIVNMSVWQSVEALFDYTYKSGHVEVFRRRQEWFSKLGSHHLAMWWVPSNRLPTIEDARDKLAYMDKHGITPLAFTFKQRFTVQEMLAYSPIQS